MKILHLTDTHLGNHLTVRGAPEGWHRGLDHEAAMARALEPAMRGEVDLVVHSGDVFNRSRPSPDAMRAAARLLTRVARRTPIVVIPGNHDRRGVAKSLPWRAPNIHICERPERLVVGAVALALVPFFRRAGAWADAARRAVGQGVDLLVAHQAFDGAIVPGLVFRAGEQLDTIGEQHLPDGVDHILCGHIHPRQVTVVGETRVVQPGSTERTAFSEAHETKGTAIWSLDRHISFEFRDLPTRPMRRIQTHEDLAGLQPGTLTQVTGQVPDELVLETGAWLVGSGRPRVSPPPRRQLGLFPRRSRFTEGPQRLPRQFKPDERSVQTPT
ncbi:MAG: hypothetical protein GY913_12075 [Proteobacteria bacterium]|nr:hypothetical protein [Pseudomonadota bacterium]MCP4917653.1 hypothetical protein [Pseudomonadota bacterium]